ncbi:MAG: hypothetical protein ACOH1I_09700 [Gallionellaceae bacterium]|jgi:hypothetical protein
MKSIVTVPAWQLLVALVVLTSACSSKPLKVAMEPEKKVTTSKPLDSLAGNVPDWVKNGSGYFIRNNARLIYGVANAIPVGDLAQQKSISDDAARGKISMLLTSYLDALSSLYDYASPAVNHVDAYLTAPARYADSIQPSMANARIVSSWRDKTTNTIWSLAELDLIQVRNAMDVIKNMDVARKDYFDGNAESFFDSIVSQK